MFGTVEKISDEIFHVIYAKTSIPSSGLHDCNPVSFTWNEKEVITQTEVRFTPKTVYRYETDDSLLKKKMTANGEVSYSEDMIATPAGTAYSIELSFIIGKDDILSGLGQYEDGILDYRNRTEYLYESNMRIAIPFLVTTGHYAVLIDSQSCLVFTSRDEKITFSIDSGHGLSYYVFLGNNIEDLTRCYHRITGAPSMLPRWAFGYIQSRERYKTGSELEEVASTFRAKNIPVDCIVQDWYTWEDGLWGEKRFDKKRYPDLPGTVRKLHNDHIHFMVSIWPNMSPDSGNYKEFAKAGLLLPNSNVYDAFDKNARSLYWRQTCEEIMGSNADALWCDNAEPFSDADWSGEFKKSEQERFRVVTDTSKRSMDWERINSYGLFHARGIYENWRKTYPQKRVVNLTRSGYTGIQQYGAILWSGDITASYDTMRKQIVEGIKMNLCGMPYWTLDTGGFFVVNDKYENRGCNDSDHKPLWFWHGDYNDGVLDKGYRELYVRWLEFATFLPVFRSHGTDTPREPWQFGSEGDMFYDAIVSYIRLRYRLIPYLYSIGAAAHFKSGMIMRSLFADFPEDSVAKTVTDEFLLGPAFLVAPVCRPMYYQKDSVSIKDIDKTREVYLPEGTGWYDFFTGKHYGGGQHVAVDAPLERIPVFVREGSVIPLSDDISFADEKCGVPDVIRIYEGQDGYFGLYIDEGDGYSFENGNYALIDISYSEKDHSVHVSKTGSYQVNENFRYEHIVS